MALSGVSISIDGETISAKKKALISQLTIELSDNGGPESATLVVERTMFTAPPDLWSLLDVTYGGQTLFLGRLVQVGDELGDALSTRLVYEGLINKLADHQAFRRVYVDSDLANWRTDQGPQTQSNVWQVTSS